MLPINSFLQQSAYDTLSDAAMEELLDKLQDTLDSHGDSSLEVEYNVRLSCTACASRLCLLIIPVPTEWCHHPCSGPAWYICDQQAAAQQANMALVSR